MSISVHIRRKLGSFLLDINFSSKSRRIGILGASGCGKSMTLKSIAGIEQPDSGKIEVEGRVLYDSEKKESLKPQARNVGYLFQNYALFPTMTVEKNIAAGLKGTKEQKKKRVCEMIEKFHLNGLEKRLPSQLSGGQQQRVALARIMAYEPDVILLDEPFSALDMYLKDQLQRELMNMLEGYKGTVIMVSHNRDEVYRFSEELLIMDHGKIEVSGSVDDIFRSPVTKTAARLTGCKNFSKVNAVDNHTLQAEDWGIIIHLKNAVPDDIKWIGYRAHDFEPVWGKRGENMIKFNLQSSALLPFERNHYIHPEKEQAGDGSPVCWFVQRDGLEKLEERGYPDYLEFREEKILLLK